MDSRHPVQSFTQFPCLLLLNTVGTCTITSVTCAHHVITLPDYCTMLHAVILLRSVIAVEPEVLPVGFTHMSTGPVLCLTLVVQAAG